MRVGAGTIRKSYMCLCRGKQQTHEMDGYGEGGRLAPSAYNILSIFGRETEYHIEQNFKSLCDWCSWMKGYELRVCNYLSASLSICTDVLTHLWVSIGVFYKIYLNIFSVVINIKLDLPTYSFISFLSSIIDLTKPQISILFFLPVLGDMYGYYATKAITEFVDDTYCIDDWTRISRINAFGMGAGEFAQQLSGDMGGLWRRSNGQLIDWFI